MSAKTFFYFNSHLYGKERRKQQRCVRKNTTKTKGLSKFCLSLSYKVI